MSSLSSNDTEVLIAGAGPTGLTLACELRRRGVACRIIDKSSSAIYCGSTRLYLASIETFYSLLSATHE